MMAEGTLAAVVAHRGASGTAPENTLAALALAAEHGASHVEIDVSISADGVPFVHHDDTLDRCTNGSGNLRDHTATELDALSAHNGMDAYRGEPLPRLEAVIELLAARNIGLNLEIKPKAGLAIPTTEAICECIEKCWPESLGLVFSSFDHSCLALSRERLPTVARGLLVGAVPDTWQQLIDQYECQNIHCSAKSLTEQQTSALKQAGIGIYCYTVNDVQQAQSLWAMGADGVFTDYPEQLLAARLA